VKARRRGSTAGLASFFSWASHRRPSYRDRFVADVNPDLRDRLRTLTPSAREHLRNVLIRDQADRDAISSILTRYRDQNDQDWADIIDFLTMYPEVRRLVVRLLGEIEAGTAH
jgi:hypothetical protein